MKSEILKNTPLQCCKGFTLVEMLVVIAIMGILMTAGAIGLSGMGGKGVSSGAAAAEALFDEARVMAMGKKTKTRVLIAKDLTNSAADNLKRLLVISEELDANGSPKTPETWVLSSRGVTLPDQTFFSQEYSKKNFSSSDSLDEMSLTDVKALYVGTYYYYEFNAEGICTTPTSKDTSSSFIIGAGARMLNAASSVKPKVTGSAKRDFGGFVVWPNGQTSAFRSPDQINIPTGVSTF